MKENMVKDKHFHSVNSCQNRIDTILPSSLIVHQILEAVFSLAVVLNCLEKVVSRVSSKVLKRGLHSPER